MSEKQDSLLVIDKPSDITPLIMTIRGEKVILDRDLALLYKVDTRTLNQAVRRNIERFPERYRFQLTKAEMVDLVEGCDRLESLKHATVTASAFTEQGIAMLSTVLRSPVAVATSIRIMDAFVAMRKALASMAPILARIEEAERRQLAERTERLTDKAHNEERFKLIFDAMSDKKFPPQKVFFDGEFFDAFVQMKKFVRQAKVDLVVIDPYFDDSCLPLIAQKRPGVAVTAVRSSKKVADSLHAADVAQFNRQYANSLNVKLTDKFHDRYLIIDNAALIHVGASLNYLGKRCFAFSTLDPSFIFDIMARVP